MNLEVLMLVKKLVGLVGGRVDSDGGEEFEMMWRVLHMCRWLWCVGGDYRVSH